MTITYEQFEQVNLRSGTIVKVEEFPKAKKPAYKIRADWCAKNRALFWIRNRGIANICSSNKTLFTGDASW